eukprot:CAMPEP_0185740218 /NCGR_PEP_ID=MMETSP1171-20130828/37303_1 /TAXON_ID=374046 /ORGANISM="Helicotheca tamensis, Strain CCMP826" /LENGTH=184 /DNA_ID=CAMNT_0028412013 /DNA_START=23 /DNA_END=577 /DNA_ORIENTATION=+
MTTPSTPMSPFMAFLAGTLVPTLAYILFFRGMKDTEEMNNDSDSESDDEYEVGGGANVSSKEWGMMHGPYKMVLCVNQELGMGKGKIAAQCCHAAVGCYKRSLKQCPNGLKAWERTGCAKIALKCPNEQELTSILEKAYNKGIPCYLVEDAGRTQIKAGSRTVLGLGPAPVDVFEGISDHLKLM